MLQVGYPAIRWISLEKDGGDHLASRVQRHIIPHLGKNKLKDLQPDQVQILYNLKGKEHSAHSVCIIHAVFHKYLNQAVKWGLVPVNPTDLVNIPRSKKREFTILNENQLRVLVSYPSKYQTVYYMAVVTELRMGSC